PGRLRGGRAVGERVVVGAGDHRVDRCASVDRGGHRQRPGADGPVRAAVPRGAPAAAATAVTTGSPAGTPGGATRGARRSGPVLAGWRIVVREWTGAAPGGILLPGW